MDTFLIYAIIGGLFSLIGIYIKHRLDKKNEITATSNVTDRDAAQYPSKSIADKFFNPNMKKGLFVLLLDFIFIAIIVNIFDLNNTEPFWEEAFAMIVVGAIPVYAIYLSLKGFFEFFTD